MNKFRHPVTMLALSNAVNNGSMFLCIIFLSYLVEPNEFGRYSIIASVVMIVSFIIDFGTNTTLVKKYNEIGSIGGEYITACLIIRIASLTFISAITILLSLSELFDALLDIDSELYLILALSTAMSSWSFSKSYLQATQNHFLFTRVTLIMALMRIVSTSFVFYVDSVTVNSILTSVYGVAPLVCVLYLAIKFHAQIIEGLLQNCRALPIKDTLSYSIWPLSSALLYPSVTNIPLWILGFLQRLDEAGIYGVATFFASAIAPIREALKVYFLPKIVSFKADSDVRRFIGYIVSKLGAAVTLSILLSLIMIVFQNYIHGGRYENAAFLIPIFISVQVITMLTSLMGGGLHYLGKPEVDTHINVLRVIMSGFIALVLIPQFGVFGAIIASSLSILTGEYLIYRYLIRNLSRGLRNH